jgi:hypothetical protein
MSTCLPESSKRDGACAQPVTAAALLDDAKLSAADHRRRRPVSTISRRLIEPLSARLSIPTVSYIPRNSARRPTPVGTDRREKETRIPELPPRVAIDRRTSRSSRIRLVSPNSSEMRAAIHNLPSSQQTLLATSNSHRCSCIRRRHPPSLPSSYLPCCILRLSWSPAPFA